MKLKIFWCTTSVILIVVFFLGIYGRQIEVGTNMAVEGLDNEMTHILYYAALAPSSHNAQMWKTDVYPEEGRLVISVDEARALPAVDPEKREAFISMGAYARSCILAFEAYGYNASYHINENGHAVTINYSKNGMSMDEGLITLMKRRHTDKRVYNQNPIPEFFQEGLNGISGLTYYTHGSVEFDDIKQYTIAAAAAQRDDQSIRDELAEWLRFSNSEVVEKKDGLSAEQLGITGMKKSLYYLFMSREKARGDSFAQQGYDMTVSQINGCAGLVAISAEDKPKAYVEAGMHLMEVWLYAVRNNIEVQPMSCGVESWKHRHSLQQVLSLSAPPQLVLRVGYVDGVYGENIPVRRDLRDYVTVK